MTVLRFDKDAPIITVYVKIDGVEVALEIKMALDTGATYVMIPWDIAEALDYEPEVSKERINITTASGVEKVPLITLKSMSVLGKKAENVKASIHDLPPQCHVDGLLGLSYLRNFKMCIDFTEGTLEIE